MSALQILAVIAIVIYVIVRQLLGEAIRFKRLLLLPGVLTLVGAIDLASRGDHPNATDITLIVIGALIAAGIGVAQGSWTTLEARGGTLWAQMPRRSLWLWLAVYAIRGLLVGIAHIANAHVAAGSSADLLTLGVNRLAQGAVVTLRATSKGIPFTPEAQHDRSSSLRRRLVGGTSTASPTRGHADPPTDPDEATAGQRATSAGATLLTAGRDVFGRLAAVPQDGESAPSRRRPRRSGRGRDRMGRPQRRRRR